MTIITEEQYHSQPHTGGELVVKEVLDNDAKKTIYLLMESNTTLNNRVLIFSREIGRTIFNNASYEYIFKHSKSNY